ASVVDHTIAEIHPHHIGRPGQVLQDVAQPLLPVRAPQEMTRREADRLHYRAPPAHLLLRSRPLPLIPHPERRPPGTRTLRHRPHRLEFPLPASAVSPTPAGLFPNCYAAAPDHYQCAPDRPAA